MRTSAAERKEARRQALAGISLFVILGGVLYRGGVFLFRNVPDKFGYDMQRVLSGWEAVWFAAGALVAIAILLYVGVIAWLIFARLFFTRAEVLTVLRVAHYGQVTRFDRWLINRFFPDDEPP